MTMLKRRNLGGRCVACMVYDKCKWAVSLDHDVTGKSRSGRIRNAIAIRIHVRRDTNPADDGV